jgi:coproporphyrinogen III oxidase-like Fe-S oxidoreductase
MNPQEINKAQEFINQGINRLSIGIQTLNTSTLQSLNRTYKETTPSLSNLTNKLT